MAGGIAKKGASMKYVIKGNHGGTPVWFMGVRIGGDATWSSSRQDATEFAVKAAADETAAALSQPKANGEPQMPIGVLLAWPQTDEISYRDSVSGMKVGWVHLMSGGKIQASHVYSTRPPYPFAVHLTAGSDAGSCGIMLEKSDAGALAELLSCFAGTGLFPGEEPMGAHDPRRPLK